MPELPEVETVCRGLSEKLINRKITSIKIINCKLRYKISPRIEKVFKGKIVKQILRRGKYGIIMFNSNYVIIFHLGMTGKFKFLYKKPKFVKHDHLSIEFSDEEYLIYNDVRKFGYMILSKKPIDLVNLNCLGIEPNLIEYFTNDLINKIKKSTKSIKNILLDQSIVAGVGNIYASEILYLAKVNPELKANKINKKKLIKILMSTTIILERAIKRGGTSIKNYNKVNGELGYFQNSLCVYGREGLSCFNCKSLLIKIKQSGRSTFYCKTCQR